MKKLLIFSILAILIAFAISIYFFPSLPDQIATHWNAQGEADGYTSKFMGLFLMPIIMVGIFIIFIVIPLIDPLKKNYKKFSGHYNTFVLFMILFLLYIHIISLLWNLEYRFNFTQAFLPALAILFFYIGIFLKKAKRNWFVGIRTPWTISNEKVWDKTHQLGGKLFKIAGILTLIGILFPDYSIWFILIPILAFTTYLIVYSYLVYRKIKD